MNMRIEQPLKQPRLKLEVPAAWIFQPLVGNNLNPNPQEITVDFSVSLHVRDAVAVFGAGSGWIEARMLEDLLPGQQAKQIAWQTTLSTRGWPVTFAHYEIHDQDGRMVEERAGVFYRIVHTEAEVVARLCNGARWQDRAETLLPIMMGGDVAWPDASADLMCTTLGILS